LERASEFPGDVPTLNKPFDIKAWLGRVPQLVAQ
jgi:hypothetical protein